MKIIDLDVDNKLARRLTKDGVLSAVGQLRILEPWVLCREFRLSDADYAALSAAVVRAGQPPLADLVKPPRALPTVRKGPGKCEEILETGESREQDVLCGLSRMKGRRKCEWHWLLAQPIATQIVAADQRRATAECRNGFVERKRVPAEEWPPGERWCSECQGFVPLFYVQGSRCKAHASRASHASMIQRVYDLTPAEYNSLLAWQRGRCYICQQLPRSKRLAVDHDHVTNEVRGLLCANDEWGCNVTLRRLLNNPDMARRALAYVERWPLQRMREGQPAVELGLRRPAASRQVDVVEVDPDAEIAAFFARA